MCLLRRSCLFSKSPFDAVKRKRRGVDRLLRGNTQFSFIDVPGCEIPSRIRDSKGARARAGLSSYKVVPNIFPDKVKVNIKDTGRSDRGSKWSFDLVILSYFRE